MPRRSFASEPNRPVERRTEFGRQVRDALAHLYDLPRLQTHPLAVVLNLEQVDGRSSLGRSLQQCLLTTLQTLDPPTEVGSPRDSRTSRALQLRYVEGLSAAAACEQLGISRTEYQREHSRGLEAIISLLRDRVPPLHPTAVVSNNVSPLPAFSSESTPTRPTTLPLPLTSFVGRESEMAEIARFLSSTRLLTLIGPPGSGKTRLAIESAIRVGGAFPDGVTFVPIATLTEPDLVVSAIARALGVRETGNRPLLESLKASLCEKQVLLVLDNFEHVLGAAPLVAELLEAGPGPRVLATSRVPLRVRGEQRFPVPPLEVPDSARSPFEMATPTADLAHYPSVQLFVDRARAVKPDFVLTDDLGPIVAEICRRLDGLPLAIELAAPRIGLLPPPALLARMENQLDLLRGGALDLPARQQTLERTIAWSYDLLTASEQWLFRRLSEFVGGFTLEAAGAVGQAVGEPDFRVLEGLDSLVTHSLLHQEEINGEPRLTMLEMVRAYARRQLGASGERDAVRQAHAVYFLTLIGGGDTPRIDLLTPALVRRRLEHEQENARAALGWFLERGEIERGLGLLALLWNFWHGRGMTGEARTWASRFLGRPEAAEPSVRWMVCWAAGMLAWTREDAQAARVQFEEGRSLARAGGDKLRAAQFLSLLADVTQECGDDDAAQALWEEYSALARERLDPYGTGDLLVSLGNSARLRGDDAGARLLYEESLAHPIERSWPLRNLAYLALHAGDLQSAASLIQQSLNCCLEERDTLGRTQCLVALAGIAAARGRMTQAARLLGAVEAGLNVIGPPLFRPDRFERDRFLGDVRANLGEPAFVAAWSEGQLMTSEQAIAYALEERELVS